MWDGEVGEGVEEEEWEGVGGKAMSRELDGGRDIHQDMCAVNRLSRVQHRGGR